MEFLSRKNGTKIGLTNISKVSKYWPHTLIFTTDRMSSEPIDLRASNFSGTGLPEGYKRENRRSVNYESNNLPENSILLNDLIAMKTVLQELEKGMYSSNDLKNSISFIPSRPGTFIGEKPAHY